MSDGFNFKGQVTVVTGAASGIGRAVAFAFAKAGSRVVVMDRNAEGLEAVAVDIRAAGGQVLVRVCDITDPDSIQEAARASEDTFGPCDVLVNNAGVQILGKIVDISLAEWNQILAINLTGGLLCSLAFGAQMRKQKRGSIVHVSSIGADHPSPLAASYSVAKAGVVMLSRQLAIEWAADGIRSNAVKPGMIRTGLTEKAYLSPGVEERRKAVIPAGRIGLPEDVADAVLFLASDHASYITGQELVIDGGFERKLVSFIPRPE